MHSYFFLSIMLLCTQVNAIWAQDLAWPQGVYHHFGTIAQGKEVQHRFIFTNTGQTPLTIETTRTTCGCTATQFDPKPIAPGQNGYITVSFDGQVPFGKRFRKKVKVYFYERKKPITLKIEGEIDENSM